MKKLLLLLISFSALAQNPTPFTKIKVTGMTEKLTGTRNVVQDVTTKEFHYAPLGSGSSDVTADHYKGLWNANLNTPTLVNGTGQVGDWYLVSFDGTALSYDFKAGDKAWYDGVIWRRDNFTSTLQDALTNGNVALFGDDSHTLSPAETSFYKDNGTGEVEYKQTYAGVEMYANFTDGLDLLRNKIQISNLGVEITSYTGTGVEFPVRLRTDNLTANRTRQLANVSGNELVTINGNFADVNGNLNISIGGTTNLTYTQSAANGIVNSDTGTDATIPLGNGTNAGLSLNDYTTAEKNKLASTPVSFFDGVYGSLTGIPPTFTPSAHDHVIADVTNLQTTIDAKVANDLTASTTVAPSKTAVNTALALKYDASNPAGYISSVPAQTFVSLTGKPTTLLGYGITDAYPLSGNPSGFLTSFSESDPLALKISNNLSDITNTTTARTNLGLGTLATQSGTFTAIPQANITNLTTDLAGKLATNGNGSALTGLTGSQITGNISGNSANVTGTVAVANGGTGATTNTGVLIGNGTSPVTSVVGTANQFLRRNSGNTAYEFATIAGGGDAVIANGLQQFTGTTSATLGVIATPATPATGNIKIYGELELAHDALTYQNFQGQEFIMQDHLFVGKHKGWFWTGTTTVNLFGQAIGLAATGALTATNVTFTSDFTKRLGSEYLVTTAATTAIASFRESGTNYWLGNIAGEGGFSYSATFGPATGLATTTHRLFIGMSSATAAPTDVNPSTLTDIIGLGYDSADTNMQIIRNNGTGVATKTNLGVNFAVPTVDRSNYYRLDMYVAPNSTTVYYKVTNLTTGNIASGNVTDDLPAVNLFLGARGYISVGGTSSVIGLKMSSLRVDSVK